MKYVFHPEALAEYADTVQYYTAERVELAQAFINAVENTIISGQKISNALCFD